MSPASSTATSTPTRKAEKFGGPSREGRHSHMEPRLGGQGEFPKRSACRSSLKARSPGERCEPEGSRSEASGPWTASRLAIRLAYLAAVSGKGSSAEKLAGTGWVSVPRNATIEAASESESSTPNCVRPITFTACFSSATEPSWK
jgi:hypothetical protein